MGGTIFVDDASGIIFNENQVSLNATETLRGKHKMEREALRHGISILGYRADNGIYRSKEFLEDLKKQEQTIDFSGVGAHHHNGVAERTIRTISDCTRAILLHSAIHWPDATSLDHWPMALDYAIYLLNRIPRTDTGLSPYDIFFGITSDNSELKNAHVWGCPTYVLDPKIQDKKKLPRWSPRSNQAKFMGRSKHHASSVALCLNLRTGYISSQYHVVFDGNFNTISSPSVDDNPQLQAIWRHLIQNSRE